MAKSARSLHFRRIAQRIRSAIRQIIVVGTASVVLATASSVIHWASLLRVVMDWIAKDAMTIHQIALSSVVISALTMENACRRSALPAPVVVIVSAASRSACNPTSPIVATFTGAKVAYRERAISAFVTHC